MRSRSTCPRERFSRSHGHLDYSTRCARPSVSTATAAVRRRRTWHGSDVSSTSTAYATRASSGKWRSRRSLLTRSEMAGVLDHLNGTPWLMASLLYGAGLRVLEGARLRVKDADLDRREIVVRDGKGMKDRVTLLPESLRAPLAEHVERVRHQHQRDLARGLGSVELPTAIERKYPRATPGNGDGSGSSRRRGSTGIRRLAVSVATTSTSPCSRRR